MEDVTPPHFLWVIPCFQESGRLPHFLEELCRALGETGIQHSILVVDDGSGPQESRRLAEEVNRLRESHTNLKSPLLLPENIGKGGAVYAGWNAADRPTHLAFVDADGAVPAAEVARMMQIAADQQGHVRFWLASRVKMLGHFVQRNALRHYSGRTFATLTTLITGIEVYDSQCGCKIIVRSSFSRFKNVLTEKRFAFDIDLLACALDSGVVAREIPIDWSDVPGSKVNVFKDGMRMVQSLVRIRSKLGRVSSGAL